MARTSKTSKIKNTEPRIRFNWGYHDGAMEAQKRGWDRSLKPHFDQIYIEGYQAGRSDFLNGIYAGDSTEAWRAR